MKRIQKTYKRVLTIAGSDSGGGAGIQADLKTISALGCYGTSVITAVTAQNTMGVSAVHPLPTENIVAQLDAVLSDIGTDAVKIGMLHSACAIEAIAERLAVCRCPNVVLDPVMISSSGNHLLHEEAVSVLKTSLFPLADVVTPNPLEAAVLLGRTISSVTQMTDGCKELKALGCGAVLIKGGHLDGNECIDALLADGTSECILFSSPRIDTMNSHGTGCTLSSAIASLLALGKPLELAIEMAKDYLGQALRAGIDITIGKGAGPVHHFHRWWQP